MASIRKRISPQGHEAYEVRVRVRGSSTQTKTFQKLADARHWGQQTESDIKNGLYLNRSKASLHTFEELITRYVHEVLAVKALNAKFQTNQVHQLDWWKKQLGPILLSEVTSSRIAELRDKLLGYKLKNGKQITTSTVNRYLAALSHVFTIACKEWGWVSDNPVGRVRRPREPRGRTRYLSQEEQARLFERC